MQLCQGMGKGYYEIEDGKCGTMPGAEKQDSQGQTQHMEIVALDCWLHHAYFVVAASYDIRKSSVRRHGCLLLGSVILLMAVAVYPRNPAWWLLMAS